jgi:tight adherence protein C
MWIQLILGASGVLMGSLGAWCLMPVGLETVAAWHREEQVRGRMRRLARPKLRESPLVSDVREKEGPLQRKRLKRARQKTLLCAVVHLCEAIDRKTGPRALPAGSIRQRRSVRAHRESVQMKRRREQKKSHQIERLCETIVAAGLEGEVRGEDVRCTQRHLPLLLAIVFGLLLLPFGAPVAGLGVIVGWYRGRVWAQRHLDSLAQARQASCEEDLPTLLDIVGMGMQAGLSFDAAFTVYCRHLEGDLVDECLLALNGWEAGVMTREEALLAMSSRIGSPGVKRFSLSVVQAVSFGSSLVGELATLADEIRDDRKAAVQVRIAKAPVKMLIPMGLLILPAMLLVVMGPVALQLATEMS